MKKPTTQTLKKFSKDTAIFVGLFLIIYIAVNHIRQPSLPAHTPILTDITGNQVIISPNTPTLIYFWGTWCHICANTSPLVNRLSNDGYAVVSVAVASGSDDTLNNYLVQKGYQFTVVNDDTGELFHQFQGQVTPSYLILKDGKMKQGFTGLTPYWALKGRIWLASL